MKLKKLIGCSLALALTASMSSTAFAEGIHGANEDAPNTNTSDETLVIALSSEPSALWMAGTSKAENEMTIIQHALADGLLAYDYAADELVPALASEWEWLDDVHCRFTLRDDVEMTDGSLLIADDVVYSVNTCMEYSLNTDTGRFFVGAEAEDEHTVTIEFNTAAPDILKLLAWSNFGIFSEDEINLAGGVEAAAINPVFGAGKYRFKEWAPGQYILIERNDNYWDPNYVGYFKEIKFTFTNDPSARAMAVQAGDAQVAVDMPITMASSFQNDERVNLHINDMGNTARLFYNMGPKAGATADLKVRQAIDKALDFDAIALVATGGLGQEIHGYFPENSPYYNETFTREEREVDIEGGAALLAEAGYDNGLTLSVLGTSDGEAILTVIQENLRQIGITLEINITDVASFVEKSNAGDYDIIIVGDSVDARYPTLMTFFRESSINSFCIGGCKWTTPEIEEQIVSLIQETDDEKAKEIAGNIEQTFKENMCFSNTYVELRAALTASGIKGFGRIERGLLDPTLMYKES